MRDIKNATFRRPLRRMNATKAYAVDIFVASVGSLEVKVVVTLLSTYAAPASCHPLKPSIP